jgi:hypothetical protein
MKKILVLILSGILLVSLISCGSSNEAMNMNYETNDDVAYAEDTEEKSMEVGGINFSESVADDGNRAVTTSAPQADRKIIKSASMEVQTLEYDLAVQRLNDKIIGVGGYIESSNVRGKDIEDDYETRSAHFTLRIPQKQFEQFMTDMSTVGTIIQSNTYGEDVTSQVFDHEAHKLTLEVQEERLLEILKKAEKIEDIITLERELSNIRYQIEGLSGTLKRLENLVSYSTLSISLYEVHEIITKVEIPKTLTEKISAKFADSLEEITEFFEGLAVWSIGSIPLLIIYVPFLIIFILVGKKIYSIVMKKTTYVEPPEDKKQS